MKSKSLRQMDLSHMAHCMAKDRADPADITQAVGAFLNNHEMTANDPADNGSPLIVQAMEYSRNAALVKALLECGADLHWRDCDGNTLMHYAVYFAFQARHTGHDPFHNGFTPCIMEILLDKGLTFNERNNNSDTPLFAMWWALSHPPSASFLDAVLHFEIIPQTKKMLQWLSENSNNMFAKNNAGHSFLTWTHVDRYASIYPEYLQLEEVIRPYKDQEQAHTLAQSLGDSSRIRLARKI